MLFYRVSLWIGIVTLILSISFKVTSPVLGVSYDYLSFLVVWNNFKTAVDNTEGPVDAFIRQWAEMHNCVQAMACSPISALRHYLHQWCRVGNRRVSQMRALLATCIITYPSWPMNSDMYYSNSCLIAMCFVFLIVCCSLCTFFPGHPCKLYASCNLPPCCY